MKEMMKLNPICVKIFMDLESDESLEKIFHDLSILKETTDYNGLVATHCEKKSIVEDETERLKQNKENTAIDYTYARPTKSEDESVRQAIELAKANDLRLHICHLSSSKSLSMAKSASKIMPVSWEFTPHHLLLDNSAYNIYDTFIKTNPPLRPEGNSVRISDLDENSIIIANKICCKDDFALLESLSADTGAKLLPVFNAPNMKGAMNRFDSWDAEEVKNIIGDSKVLIVIKDNPLDYLSKDDIKGKGFIINISNEDNEFAKLSDVVLPGKSWAEKAGTFTNCEGLEQSFDISAEIENDALSEMEIFDKLA
jgi:hypothetical protein